MNRLHNLLFVSIFAQAVGCDNVLSEANIYPNPLEIENGNLSLALGQLNPVACPEKEGRPSDPGDGCTIAEIGAQAPIVIEPSAILEAGVQIRITNHGLAFLEKELPKSNAINHVCIPVDTVPFDVFPFITLCPDTNNDEDPNNNNFCDGAPGCLLRVQVDSLKIKTDEDDETIKLKVKLLGGKKADPIPNLDVDRGAFIPLDVGTTHCELKVRINKAEVEPKFSLDTTQAEGITDNALNVDIANFNASIINRTILRVRNPGDRFPTGACFAAAATLRFSSIAVKFIRNSIVVASGVTAPIETLILKTVFETLVIPLFLQGSSDTAQEIQDALPKSFTSIISLLIGSNSQLTQDILNPSNDPSGVKQTLVGSLIDASNNQIIQNLANAFLCATPNTICSHRSGGNNPLIRLDDTMPLLTTFFELGGYADIENKGNSRKKAGISVAMNTLITTGNYQGLPNSPLPPRTCAGDISGIAGPLIGLESPTTGGRMIGTSEILHGNESHEPPVGQPFDIGVAISEGVLDQIGFALFQSGMLCMNDLGILPTGHIVPLNDPNPTVGTTLNIAQFAGLLPSLAIANTQNGSGLPDNRTPLTITLRPRRPLDFELQTIDFVLDINVIFAPSINSEDPQKVFTVKVNGAIKFPLVFEKVDGKPVITLNLDASSITTDTLTLVPLPFNEIPGPTPGDPVDHRAFCRNAFSQLNNPDAMICFSSLLAGLGDAPIQILNSTPTFVNNMIANVNELIPAQIPIQSEKSKLPFDILTGNNPLQILVSPNIEPLELRQRFLALLVNLAPKSSVSAIVAVVPSVQTSVQFVAYHPAKGSEPAWVEINASGTSTNGTMLEWQTRIDGGLWGPFASDITILKHPNFVMEGKHKIEVRAREKGTPDSIEQDPSIVTFDIDTHPPAISLQWQENNLQIKAHDEVTLDEDLEVAYHFDDNPWVYVEAQTTLAWKDLEDVHTIIVQATDATGQQTIKAAIVNPGEKENVASCAVSPDSKKQTGHWLFLGLLLVFILRRNAAQKMIVALGLLASCSLIQTTQSAVTCSTDRDCADVLCRVGTPICGASAECFCDETPIGLSLGDVGKYVDIGFDQGQIVIAAYNKTYGDLVYTRVNPGEQPTAFIFLDGVPAGPVLGDPNGIRGGVQDVGTDVGGDIALAIDSQGNAHISYLDYTNKALKYARVSRDGSSIQVMTVDNSVDTGLFSDIVISLGGEPQISYMANGVPTVDGDQSELRIVRAKVVSPNVKTDWPQATVVDFTDTTSFSKRAVPVLGIGSFNSMAIETFTNRTMLLYQDSIRGDVKFARSDDASLTNFTVSTIQDTNDRTGGDNGGAGNHAFMIANPTRGFSAIFKNNGNLVFTSSVVSVFKLIDDGSRNETSAFVRNIVGANAVLFTANIGGQDRMFAAYQDQGWQNLMIASANQGVLTLTVLTGENETAHGVHGMAIAAVVSKDVPSTAYIAEYVTNDHSTPTLNHVSIISVDLSQLP
jgi:hypothetical protein